MEDFDVTLVIPLRDEESSVPPLLAAIKAQSRAPDAVVFVDAGSTDGTASLLRKACCHHGSWTLLEIGPATPGRARNAGMQAASTSWVALTDAGAHPDPYWLERLVRMAGVGVELVWGHCQPEGDTWFRRCAALAYGPLTTGTGRGPVRAPWIASSLVTRSLWERAGHFPDLRASEDLAFIRGVGALGAQTAFAPEAVVWWQLPPGFAGTFRRFRLFSEVNARAGGQRDWHHGVARMYLVALPFVLAGMRRRRWLALPVAGAMARVVKSIWQRREGRGLRWVLNPARVATVGTILAVVDAGTFTGWLDAAGPL